VIVFHDSGNELLAANLAATTGNGDLAAQVREQGEL
jgi:hypothetical protein